MTSTADNIMDSITEYTARTPRSRSLLPAFLVCVMLSELLEERRRVTSQEIVRELFSEKSEDFG